MGIMDLFSSLKGPVFNKEDSDAEGELEYLKTLSPTPEIEHQINIIKAGITGGNNIRFELESGRIPCYVIHDLCLEHNGQQPRASDCA